MNRQDPEEMITIDVGTPKGETAKATAEAFAKDFSGTVAELEFEVDGTPGFRVSCPPNYDKVFPREIIVLHRYGKGIFIIGASKTDFNVWPALEEIAASLKWTFPNMSED